MPENGVQVLDRAIDILELLAVEKEGLGVTEIGNRLGLHKSTVHRILAALGKRGLVEKSLNQSTYKLGLKMVEISSVYLNNIELKIEARPHLWDLSSKLNLVSHIGILDGDDVVYIEKINAVSNIRLYSEIGRRIPAFLPMSGRETPPHY